MQTISQNTTSIKLGERKDQLQQLATLKKRNVHSLVIEAVDNYLEQENQRLAYEKQAIASYQHYLDTGLYVSHDELKSWVNSLGTDNPKEMPACHR